MPAQPHHTPAACLGGTAASQRRYVTRSTNSSAGTRQGGLQVPQQEIVIKRVTWPILTASPCLPYVAWRPTVLAKETNDVSLFKDFERLV